MQLARVPQIGGIQQDVAWSGRVCSGDAAQGQLGELRGEFFSHYWR